jgi:hypothetical protein
MTRDFESDVKFNKYKLEDECEKHASIYFYWADKLAKAKNNLGDSEDAYKLVSAQREMFIRQNWNESWGKQTEAGVKAQLEGDEEYLSAKEAIRNNQHEVNTLIAAVSAMEHRRDMLKCEKELLIGGFYASPDFSRKDDANGQAERELRKKKNPK